MHEMLHDDYGAVFSYDALRKYVKKYLPKPKEAFGPQEHLPGQAIQFDFGTSRVYFTEEQRWVKVQIQAFVLPFSGMKVAWAEMDQKLETFLNGFTRAFTKLGGVPRKATIDNLKDGVIVNNRHELKFNQTFLEYANHYRFTINPCAPFSPEQKGTVEGGGGVKYIKQNFIAGRDFKNLVDLQGKLTVWTNNANQKVHGIKKQVIAEMFETIEKKQLQSLPSEPFSFFNRVERKVRSDCHINFDNNYYSVPFSYVGKEVTVRYNQSVLRVVCDGEELALHTIAAGQGNFVKDRAHLPAHKVYTEAEYRQRHETKMTQIGPNGHQYFTMLLEKCPRYWFQKLRTIYGLVSEFGAEAVEKALGRALAYEAVDSGILRNILERKFYDIVDTVSFPVFTDQSNSRDLSYYCIPTGAEALGDES